MHSLTFLSILLPPEPFARSEKTRCQPCSAWLTRAIHLFAEASLNSRANTIALVFTPKDLKIFK